MTVQLKSAHFLTFKIGGRQIVEIGLRLRAGKRRFCENLNALSVTAFPDHVVGFSPRSLMNFLSAAFRRRKFVRRMNFGARKFAINRWLKPVARKTKRQQTLR
ncbi:MAG: hypothetical protein N3B10_01335 [Armatimonadetes bacterium]|nr:hypothetical protein [Armatimonadota bacterium]